MEQGAWFVFQGELVDLLRHPHQGGELRYPVTRQTSVKDALEALGPPHTEVYRLTADGRDIAFSERLLPGMRIEAWPAVFPIDVTKATVLRPDPLPRLAFLADANVGKLATLLRLLGHDTAYDRRFTDTMVAETAAQEGRVVASRDRNCLKRAKIAYGRVVRANDPLTQLRDIVAAFGLKPPYAAFSRCLRCNAPLEGVSKAEVLPLLLPKTRRYFDTFHRCPTCGRVYWPGSHHDRMLELLQDIELVSDPTGRGVRGE